MKLIAAIFALIVALPALATEEAECPSVDKIISDWKKGRMENHPYFKGTFYAPMERALLCRLESGTTHPKAQCHHRLHLTETTLEWVKDSFEVGEVTRTEVEGWENKLKALRETCTN